MFALNHMSAILCFGEDTADASVLDGPWPNRRTPALASGSKLYGDLFFHSGRFKRVQRYASLSARSCEVEIVSRDENFFGPFQSQHLLLGDPGSRDAAVHAIQACVPERDLLPMGVEKIEFGAGIRERLGTGDGDRNLRLRAQECHREGDTYTYDLELRDDGGILLERWLGLQLRVVGGAKARSQWPSGLVAPHIESLARTHLPECNLAAALVPGLDPEASERAISAASNASVILHRRPDGKPMLNGAAVSSSHAIDHTLGVVASHPVACDMEAVESRDHEIFRSLLGELRFGLAEQISTQVGEALDCSATRVWGAVECLKKLGMQYDTPITLTCVNGGTWLKLEAANTSVLSILMQLQVAEQPVVITLASPSSNRGLHAQL
jgi:enediyne polyketide synthase